MRFTALPVHSFEDATLDLEQLQALLTSPSGQALPFLQLLSSRQLQLAFGSGAVTFTASTNSATTTVTHGIGRTPVWMNAFGTGGANIWFSSPLSTTTTVSFIGTFFSAVTGTFSFNWVAVG